METRIPQANSYETLIRVMEGLAASLDLKALAQTLDMVPRTLSYYVELAEFLGWVQRFGPGSIALSALGEEVVKASAEDRLKVFGQSLWKTPLMTRILVRMEGAKLEDAILAELMACGLAESTARRRCSAIMALATRAGTIPSPNTDSPENLYERFSTMQDTEAAIEALTALKQRKGLSDVLVQKIDMRLFELCMG